MFYRSDCDPDLANAGFYRSDCAPDLATAVFYRPECDPDLADARFYRPDCDLDLANAAFYRPDCDPDLANVVFRRFGSTPLPPPLPPRRGPQARKGGEPGVGRGGFQAAREQSYNAILGASGEFCFGGPRGPQGGATRSPGASSFPDGLGSFSTRECEKRCI